VRSPYITEMSVWQSDTAETQNKANLGRYRTIAFVEVYLPHDYGIESLNLTDWQLYFKEFGNNIYALPNGSDSTTWEYGVINRGTGTPSSPAFVWEAVGNDANNTIKAGEYRTLAMEVWRKTKANPGTMITL